MTQAACARSDDTSFPGLHYFLSHCTGVAEVLMQVPDRALSVYSYFKLSKQVTQNQNFSNCHFYRFG